MTLSSQLSALAERAQAIEAELAEVRRQYSAPLQPIEDLAETVKQARKRQKLSQRALADLSGVSQATIVGLETQGRTPHLDSVLRVLEALGLTLYVGGQR
ncbi:helix-turn-helix domain-containing protein [Marinimicrobium sp. ABcell2]|uniref:helix-turn-helix domain-containing protein n=1 Tax=Marinimicrobium sp. ABcell2 TaxID=3069751 RepID=UPI0027B7F23B|nr:helix-turn-helix domain-containing protein [Marinimicrobium sp. ABcell2]MDQ2077430.1 helix-turn-helix domain-containing protein [Marinimicrobium sp. ABcell2]